MKNIAAIVIIFLLMFGACLALDVYIEHSLEELSAAVDKIHQNNDIESVNEFEKLWEKHEAGWLMVMKHSEADEISEHVMSMKKNLELGAMDGYALELELLKRHLEDMPSHIKLSLKNFL